MKRIVYWLSLALLVFSSCGNKRQPLSPYIRWHLAVCQKNAGSLPPTCIQGDNLKEEDGGIVNIQVPTRCGVMITCTWACISRKNDGPFFAIKHGPWSLCQLCFSTEPLPNNCYQKPTPRQPGHPAITAHTNLVTPR